MSPNDADGMANSVDPEHKAHDVFVGNMIFSSICLEKRAVYRLYLGTSHLLRGGGWREWGRIVFDVLGVGGGVKIKSPWGSGTCVCVWGGGSYISSDIFFFFWGGGSDVFH